MNNVETVENFFGVYLLYCLNPKYAGRTYIGYTVDPNRRIKQHNKGLQYGGAWKTSNRGPWTMVMIIHGFPNDISALRFEWAWQHPHASRRLQHVSKKKAREKTYDFCLRVLSEMLLVGPWNRLPLTIRWLNEEFIREFPVGKCPPMHMPICHGPVVSKKLKAQGSLSQEPKESDLCYICFNIIEPPKQMTCLNSDCNILCHILCMSKSFLSKGEYVPVEGKCPKCENHFLWGDLVRKYKGCYENIDMKVNVAQANDFYCSDEEVL
ncbi:structure-specific endonuclease subunit slx1 [Anthonomus grandis grandis]|uniref:structure-specific endonuclease subunit slx1 n=1 Tax=Anthonomus grandis grandis TaxID=2921223 RepID=UPI0021657D57|nr:structure-specific endonuclease subunit slx1 [Anthonomus grandis grandis]